MKEYALNTMHPDIHKAVDAFWHYWRENGIPHKRGYYESTWGAINQAIRYAGVIEHEYTKPRIDFKETVWLNSCIDSTPAQESITLPITEYEQTLKDAERFKHIADFERVTATNKFSVQVIGNNNNYYMEYFKCDKPYLGAQFLHETKLDALRAGVDKAIKELPNG
jgi:hypothetical protein